VQSRRTALIACLSLAAASCAHWPFFRGSAAQTAASEALPVPEGPAAESSDTATLTIEPDVPEVDPQAPQVEAEPSPVAQEGVAAGGGEAKPEHKLPVAAPSYDAVFSEEDVEAWTEEESNLSGPLAVFSALVVQRVRDYPKWRAKFDQQLEGRKEAGFAAQGVMLGDEDERVVAVWLAVTDLASAKSFFASSWRRLGVKARVKLSRNLAAEIPPDRENLHAAIVTLKLDDLAYFRTAFDATAKAREEAGLLGYSLGQDVDDEQIVYAYFQSDDPESLKAYLRSRETRRIWKDAGVLKIQSITLVREQELKRCR
jgi:quinol monooxygenase YgiN